MATNELTDPSNMPPGHVNPKRFPKISGQNAIAGVGTVWDAYARVKDGEHVVPAVGKALLTGAFYAALPGGVIGSVAGAMALGAAQGAGDMYDGVQAMKQQFQQNGQVMGEKGYMEEEGQVAMRENMITAQSHAAEYMMQKTRNHARGAHRTY